MTLIDTHCHIHDSEFTEKFEKSQAELVAEARDAGVSHMICVGTDAKSSQEAVYTASQFESCYASAALHPHEAANYSLEELKTAFSRIADLARSHPERFIAIGECGLDYFYHNDQETRDKQAAVLRWHIELALELNLPLIFHIRDAFHDFFTIIDEYQGVRGVIHSFTAHEAEMRGSVDRGFYIGLNGIMTFTKDQKQLAAAQTVPIQHLVLETDAPFLTPNPFRGKVNTPRHVTYITQFLSELRGESQALLAQQTTKNAKTLFNL